MVERAACRAPNPLRQSFGLPPPRLGEDKSLQPFDLLRELVDQAGDLMHRLLGDFAASDTMPDRDSEVAHRAPDRGSAFQIMRRTEALQPRDQLLGLFLILFEMRGPGLGDLERLASALARSFFDQAHVLEHGQSRIDDSWAR